MSDEIMLVFGEDGVAREYDDTWDITIHCESEEEQKAVLEKIKNSNQEVKNSTESSSIHKALDTISRQAAIEVADAVWCVTGDVNVAKVWDQLKNLPSAHSEIEERKEESAQNVPKEDLISRKAAIDAVEHITSSMSVCVNTDECHGMKRMQRQAVIELANLPSAQPEREKGEWTKDCACEICGFKPWYERDIHTLSFCPNCGADMREETDADANT